VRTRKGNDFEYLLASSFSEIGFDGSALLLALDGLLMASTDLLVDDFLSTIGDEGDRGGV